MHEHMHIEVFKEELAWTIDKWLQVIGNKMLFKTVIPLRCGTYLHILINAYEDMYPIFK